ncbi:GlxA family transcriptional regulator [Actinomadura rupiterrae]|uniref:GlxA family transcriptional regulator n=1 Tax=Actinomadura rupiterrae TaxID=559627 RepID=UPI0020A3D3D8|nr:helix-turn-helix domain-containing protein [Actinomadura rupiterrae]MCP2341707.1 transcriptional regulator GlxA family with amidase domain [Actinomadura rupiterrae]
MSGHVVGLAVTAGTPVFELAVPCEVFGTDRSDLVDPWYELRTCAAEPGALPSTGGLSLHASHRFDDLPDADTVLVGALARPVQLDPPAGLVAAVREAHRRGRRIVALCTGAYVLAAAGLLDGRRATTHWLNAGDFAHRFPAVELDASPLYIDHGDVVTTAGSGAAIDVCLHLLRQDHGAAVAGEVARRMVVPPHREGGQAQVTRPAVGGERDGDLAPVLRWAVERLHLPLTVPQLARVAHLSERTLARRFRDTLGITPLQWLLQQRVRLAQELLETTDLPIEEVARDTGFGNAANLRYHFGRVTGVSPQSYRHVFRYRASAATAEATPATLPRPDLVAQN